MKNVFMLAVSGLVLSTLAALATPGSAYAVTCANGVYRAGCAGPNGAAVVRKRPAPPRTVTCANGVYHAGCVGPHGAAVIRK
jgi:hypothetical protein